MRSHRSDDKSGHYAGLTSAKPRGRGPQSGRVDHGLPPRRRHGPRRRRYLARS
jgi:hypothetical protein